MGLRLGELVTLFSRDELRVIDRAGRVSDPDVVRVATFAVSEVEYVIVSVRRLFVTVVETIGECEVIGELVNDNVLDCVCIIVGETVTVGVRVAVKECVIDDSLDEDGDAVCSPVLVLVHV